ncbi:hypothetical protein BUALT_Bualt15G0026300 [Buddleja alternifolia]|uniref:UTP23 sensor motif region domain-containing protein n=1 Tax=Buddleja alternifolia TaxID=168488 RepID=A0AAV6WHD8_9LAMI|nr:hypothetical protein BUALT_Bualt15G0026300 [Buddleja alternifolia]
MRVKKQKRHRRAVRFYTACFGFREPFKILCDGTFVHHLLTNRITPADTALANTLGATVKIFSTRCVLAELRSLGDSYSGSLDAARNLMIASIEVYVRVGQVSRYEMNIIPGVPVIYGLRNALFLDRPSTFQHEFAKTAEEERSHLTDLEYKMLKLKKKRVATDETRDSSDANEDNEGHILETQDHKNVKRNRIDIKDKAQFKRKKAKGPNPLSCKKKKTQGNIDASSEKEKTVDSSTTIRSRKRKRTRKGKNPSEAIV